MVLPGFNTDFKYRGETYHVQTEDNGEANPVVVTLLYHKGAILASKRTSYRDLLQTPDHRKSLMDLMKTQHKDVMRELLGGGYDRQAGVVAESVPVAVAPAAPAGVAAPPDVASSIAAPPVAAAPEVRPTTLDEAIQDYLREHAARRDAAGAHA